MGADFQKKQNAVVHEHLKKQDIVICTALIPGRPAPVLITEAMVKDMKLGSVIVDLAVEAGGNCPLSEAGKVVVKHGVTIVGYDNMPSRVAEEASALYGKNLLNFLTPQVDADSKTLAIDWDDEVIKGTLITRDGAVVNDRVAEAANAAPAPKPAARRSRKPSAPASTAESAADSAPESARVAEPEAKSE